MDRPVLSTAIVKMLGQDPAKCLLFAPITGRLEIRQVPGYEEPGELLAAVTQPLNIFVRVGLCTVML